MWFSFLLVLKSVSVLFSHFMRLDIIKLCLGSRVATFLRRAAYLVNIRFVSGTGIGF